MVLCTAAAVASVLGLVQPWSILLRIRTAPHRTAAVYQYSNSRNFFARSGQALACFCWVSAPHRTEPRLGTRCMAQLDFVGAVVSRAGSRISCVFSSSPIQPRRSTPAVRDCMLTALPRVNLTTVT